MTRNELQKTDFFIKNRAANK